MLIIAAATTDGIVMMVIMLILALLGLHLERVMQRKLPLKKLPPDKMLPYEKRLEICKQIGTVLAHHTSYPSSGYALETDGGMEIEVLHKDSPSASYRVKEEWLKLQFSEEIKKIDFSTPDHHFLDENRKSCDRWREGGYFSVSWMPYGAEYLLYAIGFAKVTVPSPVELGNTADAFILKPIEDVKS